MGSRQSSRTNDALELSRADEAASSTAWGGLRKWYSDDVADRVESVLEHGGMTLLDLQHLELAEYTVLRHAHGLAMAKMEQGAKGQGRVIERLSSLMLQSRKNMRSIVIASPDAGGDKRPVVEPPGFFSSDIRVVHELVLRLGAFDVPQEARDIIGQAVELLAAPSPDYGTDLLGGAPEPESGA